MTTYSSHLFVLFLQEIKNISSEFSSNYEAKASELLENVYVRFHGYYMHSDMLIACSPTTHRCVMRRERVNVFFL